MSELHMLIGEDLPVLVDFDYNASEKGDFYTPSVTEEVEITSVCVGDIDIIDLLNESTIKIIEQNVFDSFDKEQQEPERE
jgi:hypothetical protein